MTNSRRTAPLLAWITVALAGCGGSAPSAGIVTAPSPVPQPPAPIRPLVTAIAPAIGSIAGGAWGTITGSQFQSGATVRLGTDLTQSFIVNDSMIDFWSRGRAPGAVDVVVVKTERGRRLATFWYGEKSAATHPAMRGQPLLGHP